MPHYSCRPAKLCQTPLSISFLFLFFSLVLFYFYPPTTTMKQVSSLEKSPCLSFPSSGDTDRSHYAGSRVCLALLISSSRSLGSLALCNRVSSIPGCPRVCYVAEIGLQLLILFSPPPRVPPRLTSKGYLTQNLHFPSEPHLC